MKNSQTSRVMLLLVAMFISVSFSYAQKNAHMFSGEEHTLTSKVLNEDRVISVYLPGNYESSTQEFPVIYLLDGRSHAQHAQGALGFLSGSGQIPQSIIVAVHNVDRSRDFSPVHVDRIPTSGGADKFLNFLSGELTTFVNENYRTSKFNILVGHSFGGTFAVHALLTKPELFDAYVAISPFLHYADNYLVNQAKTELKSSYKGQKYFYMTVGDEPNYFEPLKEFASLVKEKSGDAISFNYTKMMAEDHGSIPYISLYKGVQYAFSDWKLSKEIFVAGLESIDKHYIKVSLKYGSTVTTPEMVINKLGYYYIGEKDYSNAITVLKENTKRFPKSANVYDSLGDAYESNDQMNLAAESFKKAFEIGNATGDKNLAVYKQNCERVNEKISASNK